MADFKYTYSAAQQEEIQTIRKKYLPPEEDKLAQLRRLDKSVTRKGCIFSLAAGMIGCLLLGIGMCCTMVWAESWFLPGIAVGSVGIALIAAAYPLCTAVTRRERRRIAPEIIRLTDELLK